MNGTAGTGGPADVVVLRGRPDDVELAALIAVLAAVRNSRAPVAELPPPPAPWTRHARYRGAGAWNAR